MTILIAGKDPVDAGKTTFTVGLLAAIDGVGFKPRAGHDYWFDHDDYRHAIDDGRLYGKDARLLATASSVDVTPEAINPVHRLWRPAPDGDAFIGREHRSFVLDRAGDEYVINANAEVPASASSSLPLADAHRVGTIEELNHVMEAVHLPALDALHQRIDRTDRAVVESYGDVARPLQDLPVDRVAVVEPGRASVFDGDRYDTACAVATGRPTDGRLEERVSDVVDMIDPETVVRLQPLTAEERREPERIAAAYAEAYEALV